MGQCMSRKAATALAASAVVVHQQGMPKHQKLHESPEDENKTTSLKKAGLTKGVASSFGFRRRPASAASVAGNPTAARRLANASNDTIIDNNGNGNSDTDPLTSNVVSSGRSTPHRLPPPKKESAGTKVSRFGFRQPNANRMNKIADMNTNPPAHMEYGNNNLDDIEFAIKAKVEMHNKNTANMITDSNKNRSITKIGIPQPGKFTLQSTQLPRPQPVKFMESKSAKTLANNNRKVLSITHPPLINHHQMGDETASMTEDSGVGSNCGDNIQQLERSPMFRRSRMRPRNLEMIVNGNTFDVRDLDESLENNISLSLPPLPSAFQRHASGYVRDRTMEYQRNIDRNRDDFGRIRRNSLTSSEASSQYEEEKTYREKPRCEKMSKSFLKTRVMDNNSPHSSDDQMWANAAGEAMADEFSCSFSSSDESKDKEQPPVIPSTITTRSIGSALQTLMTASLPKNEIRNVILSIEDPKFAAVAAASDISNLIEDETSPVDSIACSYSEASELINKKFNTKNSSNSKDINEKLTISSPGSPTNASNSLSLSDGREDFLIDDEIADQPGLVFDDTITNTTSETVSNHNSEATPTLVESTPKQKRRVLGAFEGSPLVLRNKKLLSSRTGSLDTLSPCESITSDDYIMDFELSQSSGLEDANDRADQNSQYSLDDVKVRSVELKSNDIMRDWSSLLNSCDKKLSSRPSRLLRSRAGTPSSIPDSPRSVEGLRTKTAVSQGSLRLSSRSSTGTAGYDSDDSAIRVDRAQHCAMQQDVMSIKTMLLKLKRVLHEPADEDFMLKSETRNSLENGFFNGFSSDCDKDSEDQEASSREELANLRRQVLFLQGQLEDKERTVQNLQEEVVKLASDQHDSQSAPASVTTHMSTCNAATQTERIRPISAGPSLLQGTSADGNPGSLVSASETPIVQRRSRGASVTPPASQKPLTPGKLWRMPGEPPTPQRFTTGTASASPSPSSIPRRSCSRSRVNQVSSNS